MMKGTITWLLGRSGGIGVMQSGAHLLLVVGNGKGEVDPNSAFLLSPAAVNCLSTLLKAFETGTDVPVSNPSPALWGDDPFPSL